MTMKLCNGWDLDDTTTLGRQWSLTSSGGYPQVAAGAGRRGGNCMKLTGATRAARAIGTGVSTVTVGFALYIDAFYTGANTRLLSFINGASEQYALHVNPNGTLAFYLGTLNGQGTLRATSTTALLVATWYHLEIQIAFHNTTGTVELRINGSGTPDNLILLADGLPYSILTGQDTSYDGNPTITSVQFGQSQSAFIFRIDDFTLCDNAGTTNNDFLGDVKVTGDVPTGDSAVDSDLTCSTGTDHFALVDDTTPDDDSTYVSGTSGTDLYTFDALPYTPSAIYAVALSAVVKKNDAGTRGWTPTVRSGGANYNGTEQALGTSYLVKQEIFELDPNGDIAWEKAAVEAAEFGFTVT